MVLLQVSLSVARLCTPVRIIALCPALDKLGDVVPFVGSRLVWASAALRMISCASFALARGGGRSLRVWDVRSFILVFVLALRALAKTLLVSGC